MAGSVNRCSRRSGGLPGHVNREKSVHVDHARVANVLASTTMVCGGLEIGAVAAAADVAVTDGDVGAARRGEVAATATATSTASTATTPARPARPPNPACLTGTGSNSRSMASS